MLRVSGIKMDLDESEEELREKILARLKIRESDLISFRVFKKSVDARKKNRVHFVYVVDVELRDERRVLKRCSGEGVIVAPDLSYTHVEPGTEKMTCPPVIVGTGPAGLFAGLILSQMGYCPVLLERGDDVDERSRKVEKFWRSGILDLESNVQFGEGGAGTFSDGKLTTMIRDKRCRKVLEELVTCGAPDEILYINKPHIGTDLLKQVVKNLRQKIEKNGGEVRFGAKVTDFEIRNNRINAVIINDSERLECKVVLLGIGHSARDTFDVLYRRGVEISQKPFSIGVRIEHPQRMIDEAQYGAFAGHEKLGAADYKLAYHSPDGRSAYTFCMCPGGYVIAAASESGGVVTNGMSCLRRDGVNANSALLVGVTPDDFESSHPLAGIEFQRKWERLAFRLAGGNYYAPAQLVGDFLKGIPSNHLGSVIPTYRPDVFLTDLRLCLPGYVVDTLQEALLFFDTRVSGFAMPDAVMTGVETRSSSPVRINRDENFLSNIEGLYPIGEGAGYAGGIISSAVDGIKAAEKVASRYSPLR